MERTFDKSVLAGVGLVVALLVGNAGLAYRHTRQLLDDAGWVAHTHAVLDLTGDVLRTLVDAETGQRGFLITGQDDLLEPYQQALARLDQQMQTLKDRTRDNLRQQARIKELETLTAERLRLLQQGIDLRRNSAEEARAIVATGLGKEKMDAIRRLIATMEDEERDLLRDRERQSAAAYRVAVTTEFVAAALGLVLVGGLVYLLQRRLRDRNRAAARLHAERERLHTTLTSIGDAVIVTDGHGLVTLMNPVAETLTGWKEGARGQPLEKVFHIVNEQTRQPVESPVAKVIREGAVVGLANHTALLARDGGEVPIDDSGAPIRNAAGDIIGVVLVFRDVSVRRRLERLQNDLQSELERQVQVRTAELRASEERFRLLVEGTRDYAIFLLDQGGQVVSWNPGAERINGYRADEIIGRHFSRFYPQEAIDQGWPAHELSVALAEGRFEDEGWRIRQDGSRFWANVIITALHDDAGNPRGFSKITRDLTEKKEAEESARRLLEEQAARQAAEAAERQLRASEERLRLFVQHTPAAVAMLDRDMRYLLVSQRRLSEFGLEGQDIIGRSYYDVFPNVPQRWKDVHLRCLAGATERCEEDRFIRPDGQEVWLRWEICPWRDQRREIGGIIIFSEVITDWKRAEDELAAQRKEAERRRRLYDAALSNTLDLVYIFDLDHRFTYANEGLLRMWGKSWDEAIGKNCLELGYEPWHAAMHDREIEQVVATRQPVKGEVPFTGTFGRRIYEYIFVPVLGETGVVEAVAGTTRDVTDRKRSEEELREADRRKDEFLAMLAHELRNPLAPIRNGLHIMKQASMNQASMNQANADAPVVGQVREMMERQVQHMTRLVDDLLEVSRITRGKIELRKEIVDLASVVGRTLEATRPLIEDCQHVLAVDLPSEPIRLEADPTRLEQVLTNLLNNAAKYTDHGGHVWLSARQEGSTLVLRVRDDGVGIAPDMLARIFEPFVQSDRVLHHSQGGLGIGLTLARRLVEMHGGSITAHSEGLGKGSELVVRLPVLSPEQTVPHARPAADDGERIEAVPRRRILVVDDNVDAAESLAMWLRIEGHDVRVAHDGSTALAAIEADPPELVFLDIGMPVLNGYDVAQRLRQRPGLEKLELVALTGWGQEEDRRRSHEAGFDHHLVKPVEPKALYKLLAGASVRTP